MRRSIAIALAGLCISAAPAAAAGAPPPPPLPLDTGWELTLDPGDRGLRDAWASSGGGARWRPVDVPNVIEAAPLERHFAGAVAWYRLTFTGPPASLGHAWALRFEQARRTARVWLNGSEIGASTDPYVAFEIEAAGLRPGEPNQLVVRVDYRRPDGLREGWWNWGGLIRPVWLVPRGAVTLREVGLLPRVACAARCEASVLVDGEVANRSAQTLTPVVEVTLVAPDGTVTEHRSDVGPLTPGARARASGDIHVRGIPALWWPERPRRYTAIVQLRLGEDVVEEQRL